VSGTISQPPPCGFLRPLLEWASRRGPYALLDLPVMFNEVWGRHHRAVARLGRANVRQRHDLRTTEM
jgi:hypothetical protein